MYTLAWLRVGGLETHTHTEKGRKVNVDGWLVKIAFLFHNPPLYFTVTSLEKNSVDEKRRRLITVNFRYSRGFLRKKKLTD
jgi:hypothetical protein